MGANGPLGQKLWLVAKALHLSPFSNSLQELTIPQLDWIVEKIAQDNPDKIRLSRNGEDSLPEGAKQAITSVALWDSKRGKAKEEAIKQLFTPEQLSKLRAHPRKRDKVNRLYVNPNFPLPQ